MEMRRRGNMSWTVLLLGLVFFCLTLACRAADSPLLAQGKTLLASTDPLQQARGAAMLGFCPGDDTIALLRPVFEKNDFSFVRGSAALALGQLHDTTMLPALLTAAQHMDSGIQSYAIAGLGALGDGKAVPPLIALLHDKALPPSLNADIAAALGNLRDKSAVPDLLPLLQDANPTTRMTTLHVLMALRDARALEAIAALLQDPDEGTRASAAYALGFIPGDATVTRLLAFLDTEKADKPCTAAVQALARLHAEKSLPQLFKRFANMVAADHGTTRRVMALAGGLASFGPLSVKELCALLDGTLPKTDPLSDLSTMDKYQVISYMLWSGWGQTDAIKQHLLAVLQTQETDQSLFMQALALNRNWPFVRPLSGIYDPFFENIAIGPPQAQRDLRCRDDAVVNHFNTRLLTQKGNGAWDALNYLKQLADPAIARAYAPLLENSDGTGIPAMPGMPNYDKVVGLTMLSSIGDACGMPALLAMLGSKDNWTRNAALNYYQVTTPPKDLAPLLDALHSPDANSRKALVDLLGRMRDSRAVPALIALLQGDANDGVQEHAALALGRIGDKEAVAPLIAALKCPTEWVRSAAAWALGKLGDTHATDALAAAIPGNHPNFQVRAAHALLELGDPRGIDPSIDSMKQTTVDYLPGLGAGGFVRAPQLHSLNAAEQMVSYINDHAHFDKEYFLRALGTQGDPRAVQPLFALLEDPAQPSNFRADAALAIGGIGWLSATARLADLAIDEPDSAVRTAMALALQGLGDPHAGDMLLALAQDETNLGRGSAIDALASLKDPRVAPLCKALLGDGDPLIRALAARNLAQLKDPQAAKALVSVLAEDRDTQAHQVVISAMGALKDRQFVVFLKMFLPKASSDERIAILRALGDIADPATAATVTPYTQDVNPLVRYAAHAALKKIPTQ